MLVLLLSGSASVILFALSAWLILRASAKPPSPIRTQSRRSQEEYAFKRHCTALRRQGFLCLMAGAVNLGLCLTLGMWSVMSDGD